jgi:hypothetical protein
MHNIVCLCTSKAGTLLAGTPAVCSKRLSFTKGGGEPALNCLCEKTAGWRRPPILGGVRSPEGTS